MKKDITSQNQTQDQNQKVKTRLEGFFASLRIPSLLKKAGIVKKNGIRPVDLLISLISLVFSGQSFFQAYKDGSEGFSDDTMFRLLENPKHNWRRLLLSVAAIIVKSLLMPLTSESRVKCLIADDTIYERNRSKKVELLARVWDHSINKMIRGFRMLTLAWTDGNSTIGLDVALLSSAKKANRIQEITKAVDKRSCGYARRMEAMTEMPEVLVKMIKRALFWGIKAQYILMDSWFCFPNLIAKILECGIHIISMAKKTSKIHYLLDGLPKNVKQIYRSLRKKRGKAKILTSIIVHLKETNQPLKLVFVRNRNKRRDWLVLVSTDIELSDEEIIRLYGYRWEIEVLFKMCKHYLRLTKEIQIRDFDGMIAHATTVILRYNFLSVERRLETDMRTFGEIFFTCTEEAKDLDLFEALKRILSLVIAELRKLPFYTETIIDAIIDSFFKALNHLYPQLVMHGCES